MPQDEVPLYESKGKQWAKAKEGNSIPGLAPGAGSGGGGGGGNAPRESKQGSGQAHSGGGSYIPDLVPNEVSIGDLLANSKSKNQKKKKNKGSTQSQGDYTNLF